MTEAIESYQSYLNGWGERELKRRERALAWARRNLSAEGERGRTLLQSQLFPTSHLSSSTTGLEYSMDWRALQQYLLYSRLSYFISLGFIWHDHSMVE